MKKIKINESLVKHVGHLARLEISESEVFEYKKNFTEILDYIEQLGNLDTQEVKPLSNPLTEHLDQFLELSENKRKQRSDEIDSSLPVGKVLENSPNQKNQQFKIQAVIEDQ